MTRLHTFDLPSISRLAIGFDNMFNELNQMASTNTNYPPYNVIQVNDTDYLVEVAVAGFAESELSIEFHDGKLYMTGKKVPATESSVYLHQGISNRDFTRILPLAKDIEVLGATVKNGLLQVSLQKIVPDEMKPRKIPIAIAN